MDLEPAVIAELWKHQEHGLTSQELARNIIATEAQVLIVMHKFRREGLATITPDGRWKPIAP